MTRTQFFLAILTGIIVAISRSLIKASNNNGKHLSLLRLSSEIIACGFLCSAGAVLALEYIPKMSATVAIALSGVAAHLGLHSYYRALVKSAVAPIGLVLEDEKAMTKSVSAASPPQSLPVVALANQERAEFEKKISDLERRVKAYQLNEQHQVGEIRMLETRVKSLEKYKEEHP